MVNRRVRFAIACIIAALVFGAMFAVGWWGPEWLDPDLVEEWRWQDER